MSNVEDSSFYDSEARILGLNMSLILVQIQFRLILIELILRDIGRTVR